MAIAADPQGIPMKYSEQEEGKAPAAWSVAKHLEMVSRLCLLGFLVSCQPSEPYLTKYLEQEKQLTESQLDDSVWPYDTYGSLLFLIPTGMVAQRFGYRLTILLGVLCRQATRIILLYCPGVTWAAAMQLTYAAATSVNVIYFAYPFQVVPRCYYQYYASAAYCSVRIGDMVGSLIGQGLVGRVGLTGLFYVSWLFTSLGLLSFLALPLGDGDGDGDGGGQQQLQQQLLPRQAQHSPRQDAGGQPSCLVASCREWLTPHNRAVLLWSLWWWGGLGVQNIVGNYSQNQVLSRAPDFKSFGYLEASQQLTATVSLALPALLKAFGATQIFKGSTAPWLILTVSMATVAAAAATVAIPTVAASVVNNILMIALVNFMQSLGAAAMALSCGEDSYALLFTGNTFAALLIASAVVLVGSWAGWTTDWFYAALCCQQALTILGVGLALVCSSCFKRRAGQLRSVLSWQIQDLGEEI